MPCATTSSASCATPALLCLQAAQPMSPSQTGVHHRLLHGPSMQPLYPAVTGHLMAWPVRSYLSHGERITAEQANAPQAAAQVVEAVLQLVGAPLAPPPPQVFMFKYKPKPESAPQAAAQVVDNALQLVGAPLAGPGPVGQLPIHLGLYVLT